jgi:hypothetical protein
VNTLRLIYRPEDEWHGELSATVESDGFSGRGSAWFGINQLREFCSLAGRFPIDGDKEPTLAGGFFEAAGDALQQCHLGVRLSPHNRTGSIRVTVTLGTPSQNGEDADLHQSVTIRFLVSYGDVERFRISFSAMLEGHAEEAKLEATPS